MSYRRQTGELTMGWKLRRFYEVNRYEIVSAVIAGVVCGLLFVGFWGGLFVAAEFEKALRW